MKRLFSKAMLVALITSLMPAQSAKAKSLDVGIVAGATLIGGVIGKCISDYVIKSYKKEADDQTRGLRILTEAASADFNNLSYDPRNRDFQLGEEGSWTEERTNGFIFGLHLPQPDTLDLRNKVENYRANLGTQKRAATKKTLFDTCNNHSTKIQADAKRNSTIAKYGLPILGAVFGFIYGWLNK